MMGPTIKPVDPDLFWKESIIRHVFICLAFAFGFVMAVHKSGAMNIPVMQDVIDNIARPFWKFCLDSGRLLTRCNKPTRKEFSKIAIATAIGFCLMGFLGFFVKLIHIPINNIIVS